MTSTNRRPPAGGSARPPASTSATSAPPGGRSVIPEVDLEALALGYAHRKASAAALEHARSAVDGLLAGHRAVDLGGGNGSHAAEWVDRGIRSVVLDPSRAMLREARTHPGLLVVGGRAQSLPFRSGTFAVAYFHLSLHYGDWRLSLREASRVLQPGGRCVIWTLGARHHRASMLARWFPSVAAIDSQRFPEPDDVRAFLSSAGLLVESGVAPEIVKRTAGDWATAVENGFVSTLQLIDRDELRRGLEMFRRAHPDAGELIEYRLDYDWIRAVVPDA